MNFIKPKSLAELLQNINEVSNSKRYFLAGGTDLNVQIKNGTISEGKIIYINHIDEFKGIKKDSENIEIGALSTFDEIINSKLIKSEISFLSESLRYFASPLIRTIATIGGNIANASPTNDVTPPLLVLNASLKLISLNGERIIPLSNFYKGYKIIDLRNDEIIKSIIIPKIDMSEYLTFYEKIGSRKTLTISKATMTGLMKKENKKIADIKLAVGSLNEFPRRLSKLENYLSGIIIDDISSQKIAEILKSEISPISDLRSDKDYRFQVCLNLIIDFVLGY